MQCSGRCAPPGSGLACPPTPSALLRARPARARPTPAELWHTGPWRAAWRAGSAPPRASWMPRPWQTTQPGGLSPQLPSLACPAHASERLGSANNVGRLGHSSICGDSPCQLVLRTFLLRLISLPSSSPLPHPPARIHTSPRASQPLCPAALMIGTRFPSSSSMCGQPLQQPRQPVAGRAAPAPAPRSSEGTLS